MWVRPIFQVLCLPLPVLRAQRPEEARHYPPLGDSAETGVALVLRTPWKMVLPAFRFGGANMP